MAFSSTPLYRHSVTVFLKSLIKPSTLLHWVPREEADQQEMLRRHLEKVLMVPRENVSLLSLATSDKPPITFVGKIVFALAQESTKRTKGWYEESDKGRR